MDMPFSKPPLIEKDAHFVYPLWEHLNESFPILYFTWDEQKSHLIHYPIPLIRTDSDIKDLHFY